MLLEKRRNIWINVLYDFLEATRTCKQTVILRGQFLVCLCILPIWWTQWNVNTFTHIHTHKVVFPSWWYSTSAGQGSRQDRWLQLYVQQSEHRVELARWLCPPCFLTGSTVGLDWSPYLSNALSSVKVMVHMDEGKRDCSWWFQPKSLRRTRSQRQITRIRGHMSDSTIPFLFITLTFRCYKTLQ